MCIYISSRIHKNKLKKFPSKEVWKNNLCVVHLFRKFVKAFFCRFLTLIGRKLDWRFLFQNIFFNTFFNISFKYSTLVK